MRLIKDIKACERLINQVINESIEIHAESKNWRDYLIRSIGDDEHIIIQPTYNDVFHNIEDFIEIAIACGCYLYVDIQENQEGKLTPTLNIF